MKKKMMALVLCVALVAVAAVGATMAYFTDKTQEVKNTFTVGNVDITLDEATVDELGVKTSDARTTTGNEYKLIPGHTYTKDPTVTVKQGSEKCYVRAIVTINKAKKLDEIFAPGVELNTILTGTDLTKWTLKAVEKDATNDARIYTLEYYAPVDASAEDVKLPELFKELVVPTSLTNGQLAELQGLEIKVEAHAIQAEGFKDAAEAWENF